jgi:hypothetical protein
MFSGFLNFSRSLSSPLTGLFDKKRPKDIVTSSFDVNDLKLAGWYQGVIFEVSKKGNLNEGFFIILNQTCDLLHSSLSDEPFVEVVEVTLIGAEIDKKTEELQNGKSTRKTVVKCDNNQFYSVPSVTSRALLPRDMLLNYKPLTKVLDLRGFSSWIGRRYDRVAYPDAFCELFPNAKKNNAEKAYKKFVQFIRKYDSSIPEVWVSLNNWGELDIKELYKMNIILIINDVTVQEEIENKFEELMEGVETPKKGDGPVQKEGIKGCLVGIEIENYYVLEMSEFTRAEMEYYSLYNVDYISHTSGESLPKYR